MKNERRILVAVYGSLLSGLGNHGVLSRFSAEFVSRGTVRDFALYPYAGTSFPACAPLEDAEVRVEVYSVTEIGLAALDRLEGFPRFYSRREVRVDVEDRLTENARSDEYPDGEALDAWIYFLTPKNASSDGTLPRIEDGDWKRYIRENRPVYRWRS